VFTRSQIVYYAKSKRSYILYIGTHNTKHKCRYGAHKYIIVLMAYLANHDRLLLLFCPELIAAHYRETHNIMHTVRLYNPRRQFKRIPEIRIIYYII